MNTSHQRKKRRRIIQKNRENIGLKQLALMQPNESVYKIVSHVLKYGPRYVGMEWLSKEDAYAILWSIIFNQLKNAQPRK